MDSAKDVSLYAKLKFLSKGRLARDNKDVDTREECVGLMEAKRHKREVNKKHSSTAVKMLDKKKIKKNGRTYFSIY